MLDKQGLAAVTLSVNWSDARAVHEERLHVEKLSAWREADILPPDIGTKIPGMRAGDHAQSLVQPGEAIDTWEPSRQFSVKPSCFDRHHRRGLVVEPHLGRFYPRGFFQGVPGIYSDSADPARITGLTRERLDIDINQPLARFPLQVQFRLNRVLPGYDRRGGRCTGPLDDLLRYPGLAAPLADGQAADYGDDTTGMSRMDELSGPDIISVPRHFVTQQAHWQNQSEGQDSMINRKIFRDPILLVLLGVLAASLLAFFFEILPYPFGLLVLSVFIAARIVHKSQFR